MREAIADGKVAQPTRIRRVPRPDEPEADPEADEDRTAHDQRAQNLVAEDRILSDDPPQTARRDDEPLARLDNHRRHEHPLTGDQAKLAEKASRTVDADHLLAGARVLDQGHLALNDHEEVAVPLTLAVKDVSDLDLPGHARRGDRGDLVVGQPRVR